MIQNKLHFSFFSLKFNKKNFAKIELNKRPEKISEEKLGIM